MKLYFVIMITWLLSNLSEFISSSAFHRRFRQALYAENPCPNAEASTKTKEQINKDIVNQEQINKDKVKKRIALFSQQPFMYQSFNPTKDPYQYFIKSQQSNRRVYIFLSKNSMRVNLSPDINLVHKKLGEK